MFRKTVKESIEYGPHIFIDTSVFTDEKYTQRDVTIVHSLDAISTKLEIKSKMYILVGIVHYINSSGSIADSAHYVAYACCGAHWYEYDDLKKKRNLINAKTTIKPHLIYYINIDTN